MLGTGKQFCLRLAKCGMLARTPTAALVQLAPLLVISHDEIDWVADRFTEALGNP